MVGRSVGRSTDRWLMFCAFHLGLAFSFNGEPLTEHFWHVKGNENPIPPPPSYLTGRRSTARRPRVCSNSLNELRQKRKSREKKEIVLFCFHLLYVLSAAACACVRGGGHAGRQGRPVTFNFFFILPPPTSAIPFPSHILPSSSWPEWIRKRSGTLPKNSINLHFCRSPAQAQAQAVAFTLTLIE